MLKIDFQFYLRFVAASSSNFFQPLMFIPAAFAGVFPSNAMCGLTKLYCILCPSANCVLTVFHPWCTFTLLRKVPLSLSILLLFVCCFLGRRIFIAYIARKCLQASHLHTRQTDLHRRFTVVFKL